MGIITCALESENFKHFLKLKAITVTQKKNTIIETGKGYNEIIMVQ